MVPYHFYVLLAQNLPHYARIMLITTYYAQNSASKIQNALVIG